MTTRHLVDPELLAFLDQFPYANLELTDQSLREFRASFPEAFPLGDPDQFGVTREQRRIPTSDDGFALRCLIYAPTKREGLLPAFFHLHGGGYVIGSPDGSDARNTQIAARLGALVMSIDYRLAPEYPHPTPLNDCLAGLSWLFDNAETLGVDSTRIAIGGDSAGGGLAAGLALRVRDETNLKLAFQHLTYPMIDARTGAGGEPHDPLLGEHVWNANSNQFAWKAYLGGTQPVAPAVPARAEHLGDLPPCWIGVGGLDLFLDENINYARRLTAAGIPTTLNLYPGAFHGFDRAPDATISHQFEADYFRALARGLGCDLSNKPHRS